MLGVYLLIDFVIALFCFLSGFFPNVSWLVNTTWIFIAILTIWNLFCMISQGFGGIIGGLIINYIVPFAVVSLITYKVFGFLDVRTLYFCLSGVALTSIMSQLQNDGF